MGLELKVVICGASVAGLHVAQFLLSSSLDVDVELYERKKTVGDGIVCGGGVASYMLRKCKVEVPEDFVASHISKVRFYSPGFDFAEYQMKKEYGLVLWRDRWEKWIGEQIEELGGKFRFGVRNPSFRKADVIVGADGLIGITRRLANLPFPARKDVHIGVQGVFKLTDYPEETISLFFGHHIAPEGYGWIFPLQGTEYRIGLGVPLSIGNVSEFFKRFTDELQNLGFKPVQIESMKAKLIPTTQPPKTNVYGKIAFVGDAGLLVDPATGGGIGPAIISARCLVEALDRSDLKYYDRLWKSELYGRNKTRYTLKKILTELSDGEWEMLIELLKEFKPISESLGTVLLHLILELVFKHPRLLVKHKVLRRLVSSKVFYERRK